ncbi:MAG: hypothetical protein QM758_12245 [Armatimonas sp.]
MNSYTVNPALFANGFFPGASTVALAAVSRPAETVMTYDGNVTAGAAPGLQVQLVQARHNGTFSASYVDGHAKSLPATLQAGTVPQFVAVPVTPKQLKQWRVGAAVTFYGGMLECNGLPQ